MTNYVRDPETGDKYFFVGCSECGAGEWLVAVKEGADMRDRRTAMICQGCGHAATGRFITDEPLQLEPDRRPT